MAQALSRRHFLRVSGATVALALLRLRPSKAAAEAAAIRSGTGAPRVRSYRGFEDVYREKWTWDRVVRASHYSNCGYQRCAWNVYVKDGIVWREEQLGGYEQTNPELVDFNPRGCQKGACYSDRMYDPSRLTSPLKRVGRRGGGRWKRVSWDRALTDIADRMIDVLVSEEHGPGAVYWDLGSASANGCHAVGLTRSAYLLDTPILENTTEMGDHAPGVTTTAGKVIFTSSLDDLARSDLIFIWGGNPNYTHIPQAHFIYEARYNGAYVVTVAPDYSPSAIHADEWLPVNVGADAALALSMARVIVDERLYDTEFLVEQTDMPLLVRTDNGRFLRQSDLEQGGADDVFYLWDKRDGRAVEAPRRRLALGKIRPALEGSFEVAGRRGRLEVTTVFERLKQQLADYAPEQTAETSGIHPAVARRLARRIARAKACSSISQTNFSKYYHGMEMERSVMLLFALGGHFGKPGAGYSAVPMLSISGAEPITVADGRYAPKIGVALTTAKSLPGMARMAIEGYSREMMVYHFAREDYARGNIISTPLVYYAHCGLEERYGGAKRWDPSLPREFSDYLREAVEKKWQFVPERPPRILFATGGNMFRRARGYDRLLEKMLPELDLLVTVDWRMSNTARYSDYVLPAAGYYEKDDIAWSSALAPFTHATVRAVDPVGQSKSDWAFHCLLLKKIQQRARERGLGPYTDRHGETRRLDSCYDDFTFQGRFTEDNPEDMLQELLEVSTNVGGIGWKELREKGFRRFTGVGMGVVHIGNASDIEPHEPIVANSWYVQKKTPWPTLTRRLQFYIDHPFYEELGEVLPVHKDNPPIGGDYPLQMTSGHNRWSIHAAWRDHRELLQLQRGVPLAFLSAKDAARRGIRDGDAVRVSNDLGAFEIQAAVSPAVKPGQVIVYHAWEPYQFKGARALQRLMPSPLNPVQLAGGYFHLQPMVMMQQAGGNDRGVRVEVEKS